MPTVSVLLPTYNQAKFLPDALAALRSQTFRDFELIACDDGSTDETAEILKAGGVRTITHGRNRGTAAAINSAAALATGDARYLTWVSSDNVMSPDWLARLAGALDANPKLGAVYSAYTVVSLTPAPGTKAPRPKIMRRTAYDPGELIADENCYFGPSFLIRREVWQEHRGGTAHDYDNWARVEEACRVRGWTIGHVDKPLCDYRHGDWNTIRRRPDLYDAPKWRAQAIERRQLRRNWLGDLVAARVLPGDEVLDLGCGIMPATGGRLAAKRHVGVDCFKPYLDLIGPPSVLGALPGAVEQFGPLSFDVVLLLDVVEHLDKADAAKVLVAAEAIARREVVVFTPDGFVPQDGYGAWGMEENPDQAHRCGFTFEELAQMGYACTRHPNGTSQHGEIMSVFGTKACG